MIASKPLKILDVLKTYSIVYLGSPYTLFPQGRDGAADLAARMTAELWLSGVNAFSPVVHGHALTNVCPSFDVLDGDYWYEMNLPYMRACDALLVYQLPGWGESIGLQRERDWFEENKKPIHWLNPRMNEVVR